MSGNGSYFPPQTLSSHQSPTQSLSNIQLALRPAPIPPSPVSCPRPPVHRPGGMSPAGSPFLNASPLPVYNPSAFATQDKQSQAGYTAGKQQYQPWGVQPPPPDAPPTPAYTPTTYSHPGSSPPPTQYFPPMPTSNSQQSLAMPYFPPPPTSNNYQSPATQHFPPPSQSNVQQFPASGSALQPRSYQVPANAPPTPAYTPNPYGHSNPTPQGYSNPPTQYFPPPPQDQIDHIQQPAAEPEPQFVYNSVPVEEPPIINHNTRPKPVSPPPSACGPDQRNRLYSRSGDDPQANYQSQQSPFRPPPPTVIQPSQTDYPHQKEQCSQVWPQDASQNPSTEALQNRHTIQRPSPQQPISPPYTSNPEQQSQDVYPQEKLESQPQPPVPRLPQTMSPQERPQLQHYPPQYSYLQQQPHYPITGLQHKVVQQYPPTYDTILGSSSSPNTLMPSKDDQKSSRTKRFLGDTLVGRVARSSVSTISSTVKMPAVLSPWGDNNPVTLPNVRYRDAVLFGTFSVIGAPLIDGASDLVTDTFGADSFVSEVVSSGACFITGNTIVKYGVFQIVEQAIDRGVLEHVLPEVEKIIHTTSVKSMQVSIKHKLMGIEADIRFIGTYPATNALACDKGWFCPYLFASSRTPVIPRQQDFAIAQFCNPSLNADTALTHKLLMESASVIPLCDPNPMACLPHARLFIAFTGIDPFRAGMWSTSRRPGCAQLLFHLLNGCPALVMPVITAKAPVLAWSPWTLNQMQNSGVSGYRASTHHEQICAWLLGLVEIQGLYPCVKNTQGSFERIMGKVVSMIINGALIAPKGKDGRALGKIDPERAGIVMFKF